MIDKAPGLSSCVDGFFTPRHVAVFVNIFAEVQLQEEVWHCLIVPHCTMIKVTKLGFSLNVLHILLFLPYH